MNISNMILYSNYYDFAFHPENYLPPQALEETDPTTPPTTEPETAAPETLPPESDPIETEEPEESENP